MYAFSIENFKRPKHEVNALMEIAKIKLHQLCQHGDLLDRYGVKLQVLGQLDLVREDVREVIDEAIEITKDNQKYVKSSQEPVPGTDIMALQMRAEYLLPLHLPKRNDRRRSLHCQPLHLLRTPPLSAIPIPLRFISRFFDLRYDGHTMAYRYRINHRADTDGPYVYRRVPAVGFVD